MSSTQKEFQLPATQHAWVVEKRGPPSEALQFKRAHPVPTKLQSGEVLVQVEAAALNPAGWKIMKYMPNIIARRPFVPEFDFAGIIADSGDVSYRRGDAVFGCLDGAYAFRTGEGTLCQYIRVPTSMLALRPESMSPTDAAALPLTGQTAWQALTKCARLEPDQYLLVDGGSTAVGMCAIQIAKARGARVAASTSGKNEALLKSLGADEIFDYTKAPLWKVLTDSPPQRRFDVILDAVGSIDPSLYTYSPAYLAPGGVFVTTVPQLQGFTVDQIWKTVKTVAALTVPGFLGGVPRDYKAVFMHSCHRDIENLKELYKAGKLKPVVSNVYKFTEVHKAYRDSMDNHHRAGKIVIKIEQNSRAK